MNLKPEKCNFALVIYPLI